MLISKVEVLLFVKDSENDTAHRLTNVNRLDEEIQMNCNDMCKLKKKKKKTNPAQMSLMCRRVICFSFIFSKPLTPSDLFLKTSSHPISNLLAASQAKGVGFASLLGPKVVLHDFIRRDLFY